MTRERITDVSLEQARAHEGSNSGGSTDLPGPNVPAIAALPALAVAAMLLLATYWDGAFDIRNWAPAGILALLVLASWMALGHTAPRTRLATASLVALWGYAAWTLLSTIWAPSPDLAWRGADRTILYATLYTIPVLTLFARKHMRLVGMLLVAGIAVIALITMVRLIRHGPDLFLAGRLDSPIRYRNATAGLFSFPVWPLIAFAAVRGASVVLRATCFAGAILCLGLAFLTQSRGVLLGLVIGGVVVLAFGPERLRRAWLSILAVGIIGAASGPLLAPYDAFVAADAVHISSRIDEAIGVLALVALGSFVIALVLAVLDNGLRGQDVRTAHSYAAGGLAVLTAFVLLAGLVKIGNPVSYAQSKWDEFTNVNAVIAGETRLGSVGGQRYDLWRVAVDEFKSRPLLGVGENNYQWDYYRLRATDRNLRDPHSLAFRILAENGLTGVLLFLGWLGTTLAVVATRWRRLDRSVRRWIIALLAGAGTVLGQSLADWTWLLPGLHGLTFLSLGVAVAFTCDPPGLAARIERVTPPARRAIAVVGAVVAAVLLALPYLADVYERRARIATTPQAQIQDARSAAKLDPWRTVPHYLEAGALEALGQDQAARKELWRAVQLEPTDFVTLALIGDLEVRAGRRGVAQDWYRRASARNPKDIGLAELARGQFTSP